MQPTKVGSGRSKKERETSLLLIVGGIVEIFEVNTLGRIVVSGLFFCTKMSLIYCNGNVLCHGIGSSIGYKSLLAIRLL